MQLRFRDWAVKPSVTEITKVESGAVIGILEFGWKSPKVLFCPTNTTPVLWDIDNVKMLLAQMEKKQNGGK